MFIRVGYAAPQFVVALAQGLPQLKALTFTIFTPRPSLEERISQKADASYAEILRIAAELRAVAGNDLLYWESVLAASWKASHFEEVVRQALSHDSPRGEGRQQVIATAELTLERMKQLMEALVADEVLALCSPCRLHDNSTAHLPMMDFRCTPSPLSLEKIKIAVQGLNPGPGAILESGRSYHYYGFELLDQVKWVRFLGRCLLLAPLTDVRYIGHRLIEGACVLRITSSLRKPKVPSVVEVFSGDSSDARRLP